MVLGLLFLVAFGALAGGIITDIIDPPKEAADEDAHHSMVDHILSILCQAFHHLHV